MMTRQGLFLFQRPSFYCVSSESKARVLGLANSFWNSLVDSAIESVEIASI